MDTVSVLITDAILGKNERCRCAVRGRPADPHQPSATLALVERGGDWALFLFSNLRQFVVEAQDLKLDNILPLASDFACEETGLVHDSLGTSSGNSGGWGMAGTFMDLGGGVEGPNRGLFSTE